MLSMNSQPPSQAVPENHEATLVARAIALVLSWPCPKCGQPGLCKCFVDPNAGPGGEHIDAIVTSPPYLGESHHRS